MLIPFQPTKIAYCIPKRLPQISLPFQASMGFRLAVTALVAILSLTFNQKLFAEEPQKSEIVSVWGRTPPGETTTLPPEIDTSKPGEGLVAGLPLLRLTNVSNPTLEIFRPDINKAGSTAVIICPGGGHHILAYDLEGTEVAKWLASIGVTGIVLKYRVPSRDPANKSLAAVQDAQRAIRVVRSESQVMGIDPQRIGILGFSAGGEVAARATLLCDKDHYVASDKTDEQSAKPNFAALIYPAYLVASNGVSLLEELKPTEKTSPIFFVHTWDDPVTPLSSLFLATELKKAQVPCELHLFTTGGHGYGMRHRDELPVTDWPKEFEKWLQALK